MLQPVPGNARGGEVRRFDETGSDTAIVHRSVRKIQQPHRRLRFRYGDDVPLDPVQSDETAQWTPSAPSTPDPRHRDR